MKRPWCWVSYDTYPKPAWRTCRTQEPYQRLAGNCLPSVPHASLEWATYKVQHHSLLSKEVLVLYCLAQAILRGIIEQSVGLPAICSASHFDGGDVAALRSHVSSPVQEVFSGHPVLVEGKKPAKRGFSFTNVWDNLASSYFAQNKNTRRIKRVERRLLLQ